MKTSEKGISLIKEFEGCRLKAYKDAAGIVTIGYGHAYWLGADTITQKDAEELLKVDLQRFETLVNQTMTKYHWNQNEFDALVSFAFNVGSIKALTASNTRTRKEIAEKWTAYCNSGGKKLQGLVNRRKRELELFLTPEKTEEECVAKSVIGGKWGNGDERKKRLTEAGYDYNTIQACVNKLIGK